MIENLQARVIVAVSRALLGEVFPTLRAVVASLCSEKSIRIIFYVDGLISEEDEESISNAEGEIMADFLPDVAVEAIGIRLDIPELLPKEGVFIFRRRER